VALWAVRALRRSREERLSRPQGSRQWAWRVGGLVVFHVIWGALPLMVLLPLVGFPLPILRVYIPDVGWLLLASAALGLVHGVVYGALALRVVRSQPVPLQRAPDTRSASTTV
jgi:hypothetical protein